MFYMDFSSVLTIATAITGLICIIDILFLKKRRETNFSKKEPKLVEYAKSFFPVLFIVLILRSFIAEPFRIPTGSMKPNLLEGDFILVNKFAYGLRLPITGTQITQGAKPKRGDVMVFRYPVNPQIDFIKRVIGLPGDKIRYEDKVLFINDEKIDSQYLGKDFDKELSGISHPVEKQLARLSSEKEHLIYIQPQRNPLDLPELEVPEGMYFVMGDNRDNSDDSRSWGFVSEKLIIGKAFYIWMSWNGIDNDIRWSRIGSVIN